MAPDWVSGQSHDQAAHCARERIHGTHRIGDWMGHRTGLDTEVRGKIFCLCTAPNTWRSRYDHELYQLYNELHIIKVFKSGSLRWLGHRFRVQEQKPCRKLTPHKPGGTRRVGRPAIRWLDSIEDDLKLTGVRNWR
jgi:hypothetical protein